MTVVDEQTDHRSSGSRRPGPARKVGTKELTTARSRELGAGLRYWRNLSGKSLARVSALCGWSAPWICRLETGQHPEWTAANRVSIYATACEIPQEARPGLLELATPETGEYWLRPHGDRLPDELPSVVFALGQASGLHCYDPTGIPALIQSPEYATLDIAANLGATADAQEIGLRVEERLDRLKLLPEPQRTKLDRAGSLAEAVFFIHETVLRSLPGGAEGRAGQLLYLLSLIGQHRARVRVVPDRAERLPLASGGFTVLLYESWPTVVVVPGETATVFLEGHCHEVAYQERVKRLYMVALSDRESADLISLLM